MWDEMSPRSIVDSASATNLPPVFLVCGYNDRADISEGLASVYLKFKQLKVPAELHIYRRERPRLWPAGERPQTRRQMDRMLRGMARGQFSAIQ
jgi:hypothetical protein